jgi:hypothetical protein
MQQDKYCSNNPDTEHNLQEGKSVVFSVPLVKLICTEHVFVGEMPVSRRKPFPVAFLNFKWPGWYLNNFIVWFVKHMIGI